MATSVSPLAVPLPELPPVTYLLLSLPLVLGVLMVRRRARA